MITESIMMVMNLLVDFIVICIVTCFSNIYAKSLYSYLSTVNPRINATYSGLGVCTNLTNYINSFSYCIDTMLAT